MTAQNKQTPDKKPAFQLLDASGQPIKSVAAQKRRNRPISSPMPRARGECDPHAEFRADLRREHAEGIARVFGDGQHSMRHAQFDRAFYARLRRERNKELDGLFPQERRNRP